MINVTIAKKKIIVKGHAEAVKNDNNHDLVCAAVSTVIMLGIKVLKSFCQDEIQQKNNAITININHTLPYEDQIRLEMMLQEIKIIAQKYPKNVNIIYK